MARQSKPSSPQQPEPKSEQLFPHEWWIERAKQSLEQEDKSK